MCRGENEDDGRIHILNDTRGLHTGLAGHLHIQEDDLRMQLLHQADAFQPVGGLAHQLEILLLFDHFALDQAHGVIVVRDDDANLVHLAYSLLCCC